MRRELERQVNQLDKDESVELFRFLLDRMSSDDICEAMDGHIEEAVLDQIVNEVIPAERSEDDDDDDA